MSLSASRTLSRSYSQPESVDCAKSARCVGGDGGESNSPSRKFHSSASTCVAAGLLYLVRTLPAAHGLAPGSRDFLRPRPLRCTVAPQVLGACTVCLRCTPPDVAGRLGRSEGDFSFASCVVARFNVGRRHDTQPRATLPVEPTRPHIINNVTTTPLLQHGNLLEQLENPVKPHRFRAVADGV